MWSNPCSNRYSLIFFPALQNLFTDNSELQQRTARMLGLNTWDVAVALTNLEWTIFDSVHEVCPLNPVHYLALLHRDLQGTSLASSSQHLFVHMCLIYTARTRLFHLHSPQWQWPHSSIGATAAALQWSPNVGDDWGVAVSNALQKGPTHQEVHQDCCTVSSIAHFVWVTMIIHKLMTSTSLSLFA